MSRRGSTSQRHRQGGFTYLLVLMAIALLALGLVGASEVWETSARRHRTQELEWVGEQFVQAIGNYYEATPAATKVYPRTLQDLLDDRRLPTTRRHLRKIYLNPFTAQADWEPIPAPGGRIRGVRVLVPAAQGMEAREFAYVPSLR